MPFPFRRFAAGLASLGMAVAAHAALPGRVWHSFSDFGNPQGTFALNPNSGASVMVDDEKWRSPWPDGSRFIQRDHSSQGGDETRMTVRRTSDRGVLVDQVVDGYVASDVRASPLAAHQILALWGKSFFAPRGAIVYDFNTQKLLYATQPSKTPDALDWMPDGSLLRVRPSGEISRVVLAGGEQRIASMRWPESRVPEAVHVSPDGSKVLLQLASIRDTGSVAGVDLWMMNVDGSQLRRFTKNDLIANAFWSPDGRYVAFVKDTGVSCSEFSCRGSCTVWYAEATASNVVAVPPSGDARQFPLKRPDGSMTTMGCPMAAWTR